jgi:hypothetical protein
MSRYEIAQQEGALYEVFVVGWDNPTQSFFAQLWKNEDDDGAVAQTSSLPSDSPKTLGELNAWCEKHGVFIPTIWQSKLMADRKGRTEMTPLQKMIRQVFMDEDAIEANARRNEEETEARFDG